MPASLPTATAPTHLCYTKTNWSDAWVEQPLLECLRVSDVAGPGHSSAQFSYRYGVAMLNAIGSRAADNSPTAVSRPDLLNKYVRVVISGGMTWYGLLTDQDDRQDGTLDGTPTGIVHFTAYGLSILLDLVQPITQSKIKTTSGTSIINLALPFNGGSDGRRGRSRVSQGNYDPTAKCFTDATVTAGPSLWTAADAVQYLLDAYSDVLNATITTQSLDALKYDLPYLEVQGNTVWQAINRMVDRRRGLALKTVINGSNRLELIVYSASATAIYLDGGTVIPANTNTTTMTFDTSQNINSAMLSLSAIQQYDQVEARGERIGVVCTVSPDLASGQMIPDWSTAEQDEYNDAATADTGYTALSDTKKAAANADRRATDPLARVFAWWRMSLDWDGKGRNEGGTNKPAVPTIDADGNLDWSTVGAFWLDGLRFADFMPLRPHVDYTGAVTPDTDASDDEQRDYLPPAVWLQVDPVNTETSSIDDGWVHCERLNAAVDAGDTTRKYEWSAQLRLRDDAPGLILEAVGGQQHFLAQDEFVSDGDFEDIPSGEGVNLRDWLATVYIPLQMVAKAVWPLEATVAGSGFRRVLQILVPDAWVDYLVEGTVVSVTGGALDQTSGGYLRDDRDRLKDIARLAHEWYGTPRRTMQLNFRYLTSAYSVGQLVTTVTQDSVAQTVNTVITSISLDLTAGTTQIQTGFAEIDFAGIVE